MHRTRTDARAVAELPRLNVSRSSTKSQFRFRRDPLCTKYERPILSRAVFRARGDLSTNHDVDRKRERGIRSRARAEERTREREKRERERKSKLEPSLYQI